MKQPTFLVLSCLLFGIVQAMPIEIQIGGIVDRGRFGEDPFTAVDIAGVGYTARLTVDSTAVDSEAASDRGFFWSLHGSLTVQLQGLGAPFQIATPDFLSLSPEFLWAPWASGIDGGIGITAPVGEFGDVNTIHPFARFTATGPYSYFNVRQSGPIPGTTLFSTYPAFNGLWMFSSASLDRPITVQAVAIPANIPDGPTTALLLGIALPVLIALRIRFPRSLRI